VSGLKRPNEKHLMLFTGRAHPELANEIAALMNVEIVPTRAITYANSEIYVRFEESVRGSDAFVIQSHAAPVNEWTMEQLIMVDALKRASAKRITVVAPFYPYARQDKKHRGREPISARLIADLFRVAGANRLMSVDLHAAQIQGFFDGPVDHLWALPVLSDYLSTKYDTSEMTVVSPDAGRVRLADMWTDKLNSSLAIIHKRRDPNVVNTVAMAVIAAATHPVLSGPAVDRLKATDFEEVVVTNTLPIPEERRFDTLTVLSIAPLIARAIREVFEDGSVTSLFDGQS
jgi:ribose-phosphate pyrophosphokinase